MRAMGEPDDTGLHDRPDWPLPSQRSFPEDSNQSHRSFFQDESTERIQRAYTDRHLSDDAARSSGGRPSTEEAYVSDLEEDGDGDGDNDSMSSPPSIRTEQQPSPELIGHDHHKSYRGYPLPRTAHSQISPAWEPPLSTTSSDAGLSQRAKLSAARSQPYYWQQEQQIERSHSGRLQRDENRNNEEQGRDEQAGSRETQYMPTSTATASERLPAPHHAINQTLPPPSRPTPTTNGPPNRSSIAKGPMHSAKRLSVRSSGISTTHIPHNNDRVRYSWQSLQDDEPNKPRIHIIKLVSNTATASAGFPTGEAFGFSISPSGRKIAAYNSARLFVLQTNALPVGISQEYALKRRPLAVELTCEGNTMAILADDHTVNVYDAGLQLKRTRTIMLDFPASCIALAPTGGLLAAAYEGGVEVFSLAASALPTDRRAVRSPRMDRLTFSEDGSTLLGTTTRVNVSSTVVISVPVFPAGPDGVATHEELKEAWCSELLHPENIRNSSHATFMRENHSNCNERLFAWNGLEDTFGILNVGDMQYGNTDFPVVISPPLSACGGLGAAIHSCPAIDEHGDTVAMIVNDRTIRLYIVPHKADEDATSVEAHSIDHELDEGYGCPFSEVRWVYSPASLPAPPTTRSHVKGRLIVTSPGGVSESGVSEESVEDIEGGRIIMFDFDPQFAGQPGQTFSLALGKSPPQMLEEEQVDVQQQVALVRRRTVNQSKGGALNARPVNLGRAAVTFAERSGRNFSPQHIPTGGSQRRTSMISLGSLPAEAGRSLPDLIEGNECLDVALEEPYAPGAPRSQASLQRAASNIQRHRFQAIEERQQQEHANSDPQGNMLPLPEYTEEPNAPLPSRYRAMAGLDIPAGLSSSKSTTATGSVGTLAGSSQPFPQTAPPDVGENFSADLAFRTANAQMAPTRTTVLERPEWSSSAQSPVSPQASIPRSETLSSVGMYGRRSRLDILTPEPGTGTMESIDPAYGTWQFNATSSPASPIPPPVLNGRVDSIASLPRSLQRAYSNTVLPLGSGPPPSLVGDWRNVSPPVGQGFQNGLTRSGNGSGLASPAVQEEEPAWDVISAASPTRPFGERVGTWNRYSASSLDPAAQYANQAPPGSSSSFATTVGSSVPPPSAGGRRLPPHMQALRSAAAANAASASLFPPAQPHDHVPVLPSSSNAGSVAHPIMAWHPPGASSPDLSRTNGGIGGQNSRRSSLASKSAFANTGKAKKLGFFRKGKKPDSFAPQSYGAKAEGDSIMETKSMVTWMSKSDNKCTNM